jgi:RNA polymerase sigma-70 factor (ECF subfamily)
MISDSSETTILLDQAGGGDPHALGELLVRHRDRLTRIVGFRMDRRLQGRIDAADVVQETFIDATRRFPEFAQERAVPFFLWLRFLTVQKLAELHRHHLGVKARDAAREVSIYKGPLPQATSAVLAAQLLGKQTSPSQAAARAELKLQLEEKLNSLDEIDREVLALRHFEQLSNTEAAQVLEISESAASNRYVRAVKRLKSILNPN